MKAIPQISDAEFEVMKVLWELRQATSSQIVERLLVTSDWMPKTIHTLISRLVSKKAVTAKRTDGKSFIYTPNVDEEAYKNHASVSFLKRMYDGSINLMLANYVKSRKLTGKEIDELRKLLDKEI